VAGAVASRPESEAAPPRRAAERRPSAGGRRILILGSYAPSLTNFRGPLIAAFAGAGDRVFAAAPAIDAATAERLRALGAEPHSIELSNSSLNPLGMLGSYRAVRRLVRELRPDLILSYTIKPVILGALAGHAERVPQRVSLITGVGFAFTGTGGGPGRRLARMAASAFYRAALARSHLVLFQNVDDQALFREAGLLGPATPTAVVDGSGVDVERFAPAPLAEGASFLMIARLLRDKGIHEFAAAAKRLRTEHPEVPIALVGYLDPSPDSLGQRELDQLVASGIRFHGKLDDVRPAIAECSVYVLPSYREGTPRSVLEAMAMGRAIITTDAPGCRETVVDGINGILVPVQDPDSLYAAMKRFVADPALARRMGIESRRIAERRYDARKVASDMLAHIAATAPQPGRSGADA